jgi:opacity protein-like surface antigen
MKKFVLFAFILMVNLPVLEAASQEGGLPGYFLYQPVDARSSAMGGAFVGVSDDGSAVYWNPAAISSLKKRELLISNISLFDESSSFAFIGYANPTDKLLFNPGVSYVMLNSGEAVARDENNNPGKTFSDVTQQVSLCNSFILQPKISFGLTLKIIKKDFDGESSLGYGIDVSAYSKASAKFSWGFYLMNVLRPKLTLPATNDVYPLHLRVGFGYRFFENKLLASMDINKTFDYAITYNAGVEYTVYKVMFLRAGYTENQIVGGFGFVHNNVRFDYSFYPHELGISNRISFGLSFGEYEEEKFDNELSK